MNSLWDLWIYIVFAVVISAVVVLTLCNLYWLTKETIGGDLRAKAPLLIALSITSLFVVVLAFLCNADYNGWQFFLPVAILLLLTLIILRILPYGVITIHYTDDLGDENKVTILVNGRKFEFPGGKNLPLQIPLYFLYKEVYDVHAMSNCGHKGKAELNFFDGHYSECEIVLTKSK